MDHQKYGSVAQIVTALTALAGFGTVGWQLSNATSQLRFSTVTQYADLARACRGPDKPTRKPEAVQIMVWDDLCEARILSHQIIINDLLRATASRRSSLIDLESARQLSIQLEDGLVRELQARAKQFLKTKKSHCSFTNDQLERVQKMFRAVYMFDKPGKDYNQEVRDHEAGVANHTDAEHGAAFVDFANAVRQIGDTCNPKP